MVFGFVPTPAKHILLVHMNMLQELKIHQGLKIRYIFTHIHSISPLVIVEPRQLRGLRDRRTIEKSLVRSPGQDRKLCFLKSDSFRKLFQLSKRTCDYLQKRTRGVVILQVSVYHHRTRSRDSRISHESNYSLDH